jgi:hypothetical protein
VACRFAGKPPPSTNRHRKRCSRGKPISKTGSLADPRKRALGLGFCNSRMPGHDVAPQKQPLIGLAHAFKNSFPGS